MRRKNKTGTSCIELEVTLELPRHLSSGGTRSVPAEPPPACARIPRITRLMALAVKYQDMVERGELRDYADIARLGYVSRARVTQIMNLANLAPDIQEELLFPAVCLPPERQMRHITAQIEWAEQRGSWREMAPTNATH